MSRIPAAADVRAQAKRFFEALENDNDGMCVIGSAAYIEHALGSLLRQHLVNGSTSLQLLDPSGSGSATYASKIRLSYCLGLVSCGCMENVLVIGDIRNAFAHRIDTSSFADDHIIKMCDKLTFPFDERGRDLPRNRFVAVSAMIGEEILFKALKETHRIKIEDDWDRNTQ